MILLLGLAAFMLHFIAGGVIYFRSSPKVFIEYCVISDAAMVLTLLALCLVALIVHAWVLAPAYLLAAVVYGRLLIRVVPDLFDEPAKEE